MLYILNSNTKDAKPHYFICFKDSLGKYHDEEVSHPVFMQFNSFVNQERKQCRYDKRHIERWELTDEELSIKALHPPKDVEEIVWEKIRVGQLHTAISNLSAIQRRRLLLYYFVELTYEQISEVEGCTKVAVKYTIDRALIALKKIFLTKFDLGG